ncbi:hypothetical protein B0H14DRAFT_2640119 [Mycena olivaceomarginata]|nr:hypothetical protein B0H14DRAFT_2640119 [Mycena olivaceomarginata]
MLFKASAIVPLVSMLSVHAAPAPAAQCERPLQEAPHGQQRESSHRVTPSGSFTVFDFNNQKPNAGARGGSNRTRPIRRHLARRALRTEYSAFASPGKQDVHCDRRNPRHRVFPETIGASTIDAWRAHLPVNLAAGVDSCLKAMGIIQMRGNISNCTASCGI